MATTGNVFPGTGESVDRAGLTAWTTPGNVTANDAADATCSGAGSDYLVARNFNFSAIPSGATITGILVRVEASEHTSGTEPLLAQLQDDTAALIGSSKAASNEGNISGTAKSIYTYGSTSDLWAATLTRAIVQHANFGVRLWFATTHDIRIDFVTMAVEYTLPGVDVSGAATIVMATAAATVAPDVGLSGGASVPMATASGAAGATTNAAIGAASIPMPVASGAAGATTNDVTGGASIPMATAASTAAVEVEIVGGTTFLSDSFTGTPGADLTTRTPEVGGAWVQHGSYTANTFIFTNANRVRATAGTNVVALYYNAAAPPSADYDVSALMRVVSLDSCAVGVVGRVDPAANTFYRFRYSVGAGQWQLHKLVGGTSTPIGTFTQTLVVGRDYAVRLSMVGTTIRGYVDGIERVVVTDGAITAAGRAGVFFTSVGTPSDTVHLHLDSIVAAAATASTGATLSMATAAGMVASDVATSGGATVPLQLAAGTVDAAASGVTVTGAAVVPMPTAAATLASPLDVSGAAVVPMPTAAATIEATVALTGGATLPMMTASGAASVSVALTGGAVLAMALASGAAGATTNALSGGAVVPMPTAGGDVAAVGMGEVTGAVTIPMATAASTLAVPVAVAGAVVLPMPTASGVLVSPIAIAGAATIPMPVAASTGEVTAEALGGATLPMVLASGTLIAGVPAVHVFTAGTLIAARFTAAPDVAPRYDAPALVQTIATASVRVRPK